MGLASSGLVDSASAGVAEVGGNVFVEGVARFRTPAEGLATAGGTVGSCAPAFARQSKLRERLQRSIRFMDNQ